MKRWILSTIVALTLICVGADVALAKVVKDYYANGKIKSVKSFNKNNQLNGTYKFFWANGILKEKGKFKNGVRVGPVERYSATGYKLQ